MAPLVFIAEHEAATERFGRTLAGALPAGTVVALVGTLGAGKTRLAQALAAALGAPRGEVTSPTFVLVNRYQARMTIFHIDAYRLRDEDEFLQLGPEEFFESSGLTIIEWADRVADCLPAERLEVRCEVAGETSRLFTASATTARLRAVLETVRRSLDASSELG